MPELYQRSGSPFWYATFRDPRCPRGVRRESTGARDKREARRLASVRQSEIDRDVELERSSTATGLSFLDAALHYLEHSPSLKRESTKAAHNRLVQTIHKRTGDFDMGMLTAEDVDRYVQGLRTKEVKVHNAPRGTGRRVSDVTIRRHLSLISSLYKHANKFKLPGSPYKNPVEGYDKSHLGTSRIVDRHLRPAQFEEVLESMQTNYHRAMLLCLAGTGLRQSELIRLRWDEVDFDREIIEFGMGDPDRAKTDRSRRVPMLPGVAAALREHRHTQSHTLGSDLVFPNPRTGGQRYDLKYLTRVGRGRTSVKHLTIHGLRHSFASWSLQQGVDLEAVRRALGHASITTTQRYAKHVDDSMVDAFKRVRLPGSTHFYAQTCGSTAHTENGEGEKLKESETCE